MDRRLTMRLLLLPILIVASKSLFAADFFWIGGSGNWSQLSHWATTSGGSTLHTAIPVNSDNIIFDANSFTSPGQSVTFDLNLSVNAFTIDSVTNNPTFAVGSRTVTLASDFIHTGGAMSWIHTNTLAVGGSVTLNNAATWNLTGRLETTGTGNYNLDFANFAIFQLRINGPGNATMLSPLNVTTLQIFQGGFDLNGNAWNVNGFDASSNGNTIRNIDLSGTDTLFQTASFQVRSSTSTTFNLGTAVIKFSGPNGYDLFGGGKDYNDIVVASTATGISSFRIFDNNNNIDDLIIQSDGALDLQVFNSLDTIGSISFDYNRPTTFADNKPRIFFNASSSVYGPITFDGGGTASPNFQFSAANCVFNDITILNTGSPGFLTNLEFVGANNTFRDFVFGAYGSNDLTVDFQTNQTFRTLSLPAGAKVSMTNGVVETVTLSLLLNGTCAAPIVAQCKTEGGLASFAIAAPGTATATYTALQDIQGSGTGTFTATNSVNLGNTPGWSILAASPQTLFWVGGTGNWTDLSHWRTTSGGTIQPCGPPSAGDDVVFDSNSFSNGGTVTIDNSTLNAYCKSMTWLGGWSGTPTLDLNSRALNVFGSVTLHNNMTMGTTGRIHMLSRGLGNTISTANVTVPSMNFNGIGGEWTLQDRLKVSNEVFIVNGTFRSNGNQLEANDFYARENLSTAFSIDFTGTDTVFVKRFWRIATGAQFALNMGTATLKKVTTATHDMFMGGKTYNDIIVQQTGSGTTAVTVQDVFTARDFLISRDGTGNWTFTAAMTLRDFSLAYTQGTSGAPIVLVSGVNSFRNFGLTSTGINRPILQMTQNNTFTGTMSIGAGIEARLTGGRTFTAAQFSFLGTCDRPITLRNQLSSSSAHILSQPTGTVMADFLLLSFSNAGGGAAYTANNTVNNGGVTGWVITTLAPKNLFWVGGSGLWSDPNHWALSSGGPGNGCAVPLVQDNVFFDQNSFSANGQTVTLDVTGTCNNFVWLGTTYTNVFSHGTQTLDIRGNFTLGSQMTYSGTGTLRAFKSVNIAANVNFTFSNWLNLSATTNGHTVTIYPTIDKILFGENTSSINGGWTLGTNLNVTNNMFMQRGTFISNGYRIKALEMHGWHANRRLMDFTGTDTIFVQRNFFFFPNTTFPASSLIINNTVIKFDPGNTASDLNFWSGGYTYNDIVVNHNQSATQQSIFFSNNVSTANIRNVKVTNGGAHIVSFGDNVTYKDVNIKYNNASAFFTPRVDVSGTNTFNDFSVTSISQPAPIVTLSTANTFRNLSLAGPGMVLALSATKIQTVTNFQATGTSAFPLYLQSTVPASAGIISQSSGQVCLNYISMRDVTAQGGATFNAGANSTDLGGNTGWSFTGCNAFYWVGGSGNWSDFGNHWSTTSGGSVMHTVAPAENDDVIFDYNSFPGPGQYLNINGPDPRCRNMRWLTVINNPTIVGSGADMNVYGSLNLSPNMTVPWTGSWNFKGSTGSYDINTAGVEVEKISVDGPGGVLPAGTWTLRNTVLATTLSHRAGTLNTNGERVFTNFFEVATNNTRHLNLGSSTVTVTDGAWDIQDTTNLTFTHGTSQIIIQGTISCSFLGRGLTYNDVQFTSTGNLNSNVTGANTINQLRIDAGVVVSLEAGVQQSITTLNAYGTCNNTLTIKSSIPGTLASLFKPNGVITATYARLQDIQGIGGAVWTATYTVDLGNNPNWAITAPIPLVVSVAATSVNCGVAATGSAIANVSGGLSPYVYLWNNSLQTSSLNSLSPGTYTVTVLDATGCGASATGIVGVVGAPDPSFSVVPNIGCIGVGDAVTFIPTVSNLSHNWDFGNGQTSQIPTVSHTYTAVGTYTVSHWLVDGTGCNVNATAQVVVANCNQVPVAICQNLIVPADANCVATVAASNFSNGSSDPDGSPITFSVAPAGTYNSGITNVVLTVSDGQLSATCTANILVTDTTSPALTCPANISVNAVTGSCAANVSFTPPVGTDNCAGSTTQRTAGGGPGSSFPVGTTLVTYMVTDANGNTNSCSFNVTVTDAELPVISCPANLSLSAPTSSCAVIANYIDPVGTDNCAASSTQRISGLASGSSFPVGTTTNTFVVTAANGQTDTCAFDITVADTTAPVIACPANIALNAGFGQCAVTVTYAAPSGTDNCSGVSTSQTAGFPSGSSFPGGITTNTFVVTAGNGQTANCSFTVSVLDTAAPSIVCPSNITVNASTSSCSQIVNFNVPIGIDNCPGLTTTQLLGLPSGSAFPVGTTSNSFKVTASNGQDAQCAFDVIVQDVQAPLASCNNLTLYFDASGNVSITPGQVDNGSTDACGISLRQLGLSTFSCANGSTASTTLFLTDLYNNTSFCTSNLVLLDTISPLLSCRDTNFVMPSIGGVVLSPAMLTASSSDACGIDTSFLSQYTFSCGDTGLSLVTLTTVDLAGNSSNCISQVQIVPGALNYSLAANNFSCGYQTTCANSADGSAQVTATGGCTPYVYIWSNGGTNASITGLTAGTYHVTVTDDIGRIAIDSVVISSPPPISISVLSSVNACAGQATGSLNILSGGGNGCFPLNYLWSTGATTEDLFNIAAGPYSLTVTDQQGCTLATSLSVGAQPALQPDLGADTLICRESTLPLSPGNYDGYLWSNGSTGSSLGVQLPGTYWVEVSDSLGCEARDSIAIGRRPVVYNFVQYQGFNPICQGDTASLTAVGTFSSHLWSTGHTLNNIKVFGQGGAYMVTSIDAAGCENKDTISVSYLPYVSPNPVITPGPSTYYCEGSSIQLDAGTGYFAIEWSTGATTRHLTVAEPGAYNVTVSNGFGCIGASDSVYVAESPMPVPTIHISGDTLWADQTWPSYLWLRNGTPVAGAVLEFYIPVLSGNYTLQATDSNGCNGTSNAILYTLIGTEEQLLQSYGLVLYPNPTRSEFMLDLQKPITRKLTVGVRDLYGRMVRQFPMNGLVSETRFDIEGLAAGQYLVEVLTDKQERVVLRMVVQ